MIKVVQKGGPGKAPLWQELVMSSVSDVAQLPTAGGSDGEAAAYGSIAYTHDLEHVYLLGADDIWREV